MEEQFASLQDKLLMASSELSLNDTNPFNPHDSKAGCPPPTDDHKNESNEHNSNCLRKDIESIKTAHAAIARKTFVSLRAFKKATTKFRISEPEENDDLSIELRKLRKQVRNASQQISEIESLFYTEIEIQKYSNPCNCIMF